MIRMFLKTLINSAMKCGKNVVYPFEVAIIGSSGYRSGFRMCLINGVCTAWSPVAKPYPSHIVWARESMKISRTDLSFMSFIVLEPR